MVIQAKCPICRRVTTQGEDYFPFCGERCQSIDLGNWASEEYKIPGQPMQKNSESGAEPGRDFEDEEHEGRSR